MNYINEFLSIVVLNYKNYTMTMQCVDKLIENNCACRIVIVDNNSSNGSFEKLRDKYKDINNVVILSSSNNRGYGAGNNIGIKFIRDNTNCKYVCIMNPDIIIQEKSIFDNLVRKLEKYNLQGITALQITSDKFNPTTLGWHLPSFKDILILNSKIVSKFINPINYNEYSMVDKEEYLAEVDVMPGCFFIIDINIFESLGYFDEKTFLYYEENILSYKAKEINCKFAISLNDVYIHEHKEKDISLLSLINKYKDRKILLESQKVYVKNYLKVNSIKMIIYYLSILYNLYIELPLIHISKLTKRKFSRRG